jgi:hypothetical protein
MGFAVFRGFPLVTTDFASRRCLPLLLLQRFASHVDGPRYAHRASRLPSPRRVASNDHALVMTCVGPSRLRARTLPPIESLDTSRPDCCRPDPAVFAHIESAHAAHHVAHAAGSACRRRAADAERFFSGFSLPQSRVPVPDQSCRSPLVDDGRALVSRASARICMRCFLAQRPSRYPSPSASSPCGHR